MNTFTTVTHTVLTRSHVHPDRHPLSRPGALGPARRREPLPHRVADLPYPQEVEPPVHDGLGVRLDASHTRTDSRPDGSAVSARRATSTPSAEHAGSRHTLEPLAFRDGVAIDVHLPLRVDLT